MSQLKGLTRSNKDIILYDRALTNTELAQLQLFAAEDAGSPPPTPISLFSVSTLG